MVNWAFKRMVQVYCLHLYKAYALSQLLPYTANVCDCTYFFTEINPTKLFGLVNLKSFTNPYKTGT